MNVKQGVTFILLSLLVNISYADRAIEAGDRLAVYGSEQQPVFPLLSVSDEGSIHIPGGQVIEISGMDEAQASGKILDVLKKQYLVDDVIFYTGDKMASITVLGEVESPGKYQQPLGSRVEWLNRFNNLYDSRWYSPSVTLIREGERKVISAEIASGMEVQPGDIYMLALKRREQPQALADFKIPVKAPEPEKVAQQKPEPAPQKMVAKNEPVVVKKEKEIAAAKMVEPDVDKSKLVKGKKKEVTVKNEPGSTDDKLSIVNALRNYVLQPGDMLTINLPGEDGFNEDFLISRSGTVTLPEIGQVKLGGLSLNKAEKLIYDTLSDVFLGLDKLAVLVKERRLLVTVLGYVEKPGEVELTSSGNVQTAINLAGGFQDGAQLNKLQLQRGDETVEFNFKQYLDSGDPLLIPELKSLDTIFVPSSPELGNVHGDMGSELAGGGMDPTEDRTAIKIFGEVARSGSYPFVENMSIVDALLRAGGVTRYANVEQISMIAEGEPILFDLKNYLNDGDQDDLPILPEGVTIFVPKQVEAVKSGGRVVYVMGQVQKPGAFETGDEVGFMDVLANAGGPNRYADSRMVRILRADGTVVRFDLQAYVEGDNAVLPKILRGDAVFVPQKSTLVDDSWLRVPTSSSVQMMGAVKKPGRYQWAEGINFMDMLSHAGGPTEKADTAHVRIVSTGQHGEAISREFNLQNFLERGGSWNSLPNLKGGVTVVFPELPEDPSDNKSQWIRLASEQSIYIMGAVVTPGRYAFSDQMDFLDILSAAQGPKDEADLTNIRIIHRNGPAPRVSRLNLVEYFESGDETLLPDVSTGDSIFIPSRNRSWVQKKKNETIRVLGSVKESGRYEFDSEMTILDVLAESGGPTQTAYIEKIIIVNSSCCKNQAYTFDLMDFMKDPDVSRLPVLRPGDTVYVPDVSNTQWAYFMDKLQDTLSIVSFVSLTKALMGGSAF